MTDDDIKAIASTHLARGWADEPHSADIVDFARAIERAAADEAAQSDPDFFTLKIKCNVRPDTINDLARAFLERQDGDEVDAARFRYLIFQADELWATGLFENGFSEHEIIAMIDRKRAAARALLVAPDGWQLTPKIPNKSMEAKGAEVLQDREGDGGYEEAHRDTAHCVFRAMLEGAPVPPPRDREADRGRYTDPAFNQWLDDSVADGGATVWDLVPDVHSAWFAWTAHPHYAAPAAPVQQAGEACPLCGSDCNERDELEKAEREIERLRATPVQQAEPVEQIGWADEFGNLFPMAAWKPAQRTHHDAHKTAWRPVFLHPPRADAESRSTRAALIELTVECEKSAAENERLRAALDSIRQYGSDTLSGRTDGPDDRKWQRDAVLEMTNRASRALRGE